MAHLPALLPWKHCIQGDIAPERKADLMDSRGKPFVSFSLICDGHQNLG